MGKRRWRIGRACPLLLAVCAATCDLAGILFAGRSNPSRRADLEASSDPALGRCLLPCLVGRPGWFILKGKAAPQRLLQKGLGRAAQVLGFLKGARNRKEVDRRRISDLTGVFFILSGVPIG